MADRLTRWEGRDEGGARAVLAKREGSWLTNMDEAMRKLARYEDTGLEPDEIESAKRREEEETK